MKQMYIVLLLNNSVVPFAKKPAKSKNYLSGVRLFETSRTTSCIQLHDWMNNKFTSDVITEVEDWE